MLGSASAADDMTFQMMVDRLGTALLFGIFSLPLDKK